MRKNTKRKTTSTCGLCKPHKRGGPSRWKPADEQRLRRDEFEIRQALRRPR